MTIVVKYTVVSSTFHILKTLKELMEFPILSFDIETKGVYSKEERKIASKLLETDISSEARKMASLVANNSGLSFPSLVNVTHFVFGVSESESVIIVTETMIDEMRVWRWLVNYRGLLLIHNTLFDLKVMYHRTQSYPQFYEDTQLMAKALINNCDAWKAKVGLKELMGSHYDPKWTLIDEYEPEDLRKESFLRYASIDGAATFKLYVLLQEDYC